MSLQGSAPKCLSCYSVGVYCSEGVAGLWFSVPECPCYYKRVQYVFLCVCAVMKGYVFPSVCAVMKESLLQIQGCGSQFLSVCAVCSPHQEVLKKVRVIPESARSSLLAMLDRRTYWCISRQRSWGVPIPVFYHRESGEPLINRYTQLSAVLKLLQSPLEGAMHSMPRDVPVVSR